MSREGTIYLVAHLPPWPPPRNHVILQTSGEGGDRVELTARKDRSVTIRIFDEEVMYTSFTSQPIEVKTPGWCIIVLRWRDDDVKFYIGGGKPLKSIEQAPTELFDVPTSEFRPTSGVSFDDPNGAAACQEWMAWRKTKFGTQRHIPPQHVSKSILEQARELHKAIDALRRLVGLVESGETYLVGSIMTILRGLVCWDGGNKNKPLLLRLAAKAELPLPMYGPLQDGDVVDNPSAPFRKLSSHIRLQTASLVRSGAAQKLMDCQEWLSTPAMILGNQSALGQREVSVMEVIYFAASSTGDAHFSDVIRADIDQLRKTRAGNYDAKDALVVQTVAPVIVGLGEFVLREFAKLDTGNSAK